VTPVAVGAHFLTLDIGLPTDQLQPVIRRILTDGGGPLDVELAALNRRGNAIRVRIETMGPTDSTGQVIGAVLLMEDNVSSGSA
jgi:two-component system, chemotaxis family, CheB/CheR fusion protein